uniref:Protein mesh n=2 Tax=Meloidogyne TaxID=189290 RepID=A0A914KKZ1_MELIC
MGGGGPPPPPPPVAIPVGGGNVPVGGGGGQNIGPQGSQLFSGIGDNLLYGVNLVPFGPEVGDRKVHPGFLTAGQTIDLYMYFPFYGGLYNYTTLSVNGYMAFATVLDQGPTINVGPEATDWPRQQDPAMIGPYLCKQQIPQDSNVALRSGVYYRLIMRQSMFGRGSGMNVGGPDVGGTMPESSFFGFRFQKCPAAADNYVRCDAAGDYFLDQMMRWLQEGVAGATAFRADAALVVTWYNTASAISGRADIDGGQLATYQVVWLTDQAGRLSYVILNYDKLGFDAADIRMNSRSGRCQALFNGGNHTGFVLVDPTQNYKNTPKVLAQRSGVPHMVRGRYMFRVDDVVRPGGCSNKTGGTYPIMIYPNIVNMLGEMTVDVNAICLDRTQTYILMIEQRQTASCIVLNAAMARCNIPKIYDWGTKTVFFQPQSQGANDERAFVGYIYFVPPTLDPMRLDVGNIYDWYKNPLPNIVMPISWYPRNFTNPDLNFFDQNMHISDDAVYGVQLGLYVIGYKESKDDQIKKFRPEHRVLCRLATYSNRNTYEYRWNAQKERINLNQVEQWYMNDWERMNELFTFRVGYLKLSPLRTNEQSAFQAPQLLSGLVSAPISLHWLWTIGNPRYETTTFSRQEQDVQQEFIAQKAKEMCHDWFDEDGAQWNFIRDVETNASCPCMENQAKFDLGRFMPHPRCSQTFRDITCTTMIGAKNCYMSSSNIYGSYSGRHFDYGYGYSEYSRGDFYRDRGPETGGEGTSFGGGYYGRDGQDRGTRFPTHYGQVCCYDEKGFLMQTTYQPVIKVIEETPYNPGFPLRAYEFGTPPYMGQFEVPGLSAFHHDYMPYFLCCKFAKFRCQLFYWRRPSSGCQQYQPPAIGEAMGAGTFHTIDNDKFVFNEPGVYTLLHIPKTINNPEVRIQIRLERYPNRRVDFSMLGRYLSQEQLVQPTNATVITGIALEATGTDRVLVLARGDTRRFRYRTSVIVGNILRYFDTMRLQRFKGVLIYVNNVERGQPEVYVVLEEAQIGVRIRESYSVDIDRMPMYQESMGILDIALSVPPQYGVQPDGDKTRDQEMRQRYNLPRVSGLMRPFPDTVTGSIYSTLTLNEVNSESIRQQIITYYRVPGSGERFTDYQQQTLNQYMIPTDNMFTTSREEDKKFEAFPEAAMKNEPIYKTAQIYETPQYRFVPRTGSVLMQILQQCNDLASRDTLGMQPYQGQLYWDWASQCPDNPGKILQHCGDNVPCLYDFTLLNAEVLGNEVKDTWNAFFHDRGQAIRSYNSCGPINIEYPEYMIKTPALAPSYMQGDTHWIKGDSEYKCSLVVDYNYPNSYRFEWNKGGQPWCRSREMDNMLTWLLGILGTVGIILVVVLLFLSCWVVKVKRRQDQEKVPGGTLRQQQFMAPGFGGAESMPPKSVGSDSTLELRPKNGAPSQIAEYSPELRARHPTSGAGLPDETSQLLGLHTSV